MIAKKTVYLILLICIFLNSLVNNVEAQEYPDIIWIPVTFYDFHSDRSNPEFEAPHSGNVRQGMVASTLGPDNKPSLGPSPYLNYYIKYWFKPWESAAKNDKTKPGYTPAPELKEKYVNEFTADVKYNQIIDVDHDTAFKNIVIKDSLPFRHLGNGTYEYLNDSFFLLDGKGFGNEWNTESSPHNFSYTMELHYRFTKKPGMSFQFMGDDDVWVFVNKKLVIDLGGIHDPASSSFSTDAIPDLIDGNTYDLDLFYAERHSKGSHIRITTNIIYAPSNLKVYKYSGTPDQGLNIAIGSTDTIDANKAVSYFGHVFDSLGRWKPEFDGSITWSLTNNIGEGTIGKNTGDSTALIIKKPGSQVTLVATFTDANNPSKPEYRKTITVYTRKEITPPDPSVLPFKLLLYDNPDQNTQTGNITSPYKVTAGQSVTIYGHLFDSETGAPMTQFDKDIKWSIEGNSTVTVNPALGSSTTFKLTSARTVTLVAYFIDASNPARPASEARLAIEVKPSDARSIEIIQDSLPKNQNAPDNYNEVLLSDNNQNRSRVYAIFRDEFNNYVGPATNAVWRLTNSGVASISPQQGRFTDISKNSSTDKFEVTLTAFQDGKLDSIKIALQGSLIITAWVNPFRPGNISLVNLQNSIYSTVIRQLGSDGNLIAVETPFSLEPIGGDGSDAKTSYANVLLYDGVGNLIQKNLPLLRTGADRKYGTVWDGKNMNGRRVGPGTYLMVFSGKQSNGDGFKGKIKIGVQ
jgi:fibro-slime domain-containing protein